MEWVVANHVARYASPRARIEQLLRQKVIRARARGAEIAEDIDTVIQSVLDAHEAHGTVDDAAWAHARARSLTRRGVPGGVVKQRLRERGIRDGRAAMAAVAEDARPGPAPGAAEGDAEPEVDLDLLAGCAWARRKRAGPFEREPAEGADIPAARAKALNAMARSGFSFEVARRVLAMGRDEAEDLLRRLG